MVELQSLSQEIIDKHKLILFDIKTINKKSQTLYLFIDNDGERYEYLEPFHTQFYIHRDDNIINNDYMIDREDITGLYWEVYDCYNPNLYKSLGIQINKNSLAIRGKQ